MTNISQYIVDDTEYYVVNATGQCGMSDSGLARLCGVTQQSMTELMTLISESVTGKGLSQCLKPFAGKANKLQVKGVPKNANVRSADLCAAIVEHYAFEARRPRPEALFSFRKFAKKGFESWVKEITGWQQPTATAPTPNWQPAINALQLKLYEYDLNRVAARETVKSDQKQLNQVIADHLREVQMHSNTVAVFAKVCDMINVGITSESSQEMKKRLGAKKYKLLRDYMPEYYLHQYSRVICVCRNLVVNNKVYPVDAASCAVGLALPPGYIALPVEFDEPMKVVQNRIVKYEGGQLLLPWAIG